MRSGTPPVWSPCQCVSKTYDNSICSVLRYSVILAIQHGAPYTHGAVSVSTSNRNFSGDRYVGVPLQCLWEFASCQCLRCTCLCLATACIRDFRLAPSPPGQRQPKHHSGVVVSTPGLTDNRPNILYWRVSAKPLCGSVGTRARLEAGTH